MIPILTNIVTYDTHVTFCGDPYIQMKACNASFKQRLCNTSFRTHDRSFYDKKSMYMLTSPEEQQADSHFRRSRVSCQLIYLSAIADGK